MTTLLALAVLFQGDSPFAPEAKYRAKITFDNGSVMWIKGAKYKFEGTLRGGKGVIVHDGESTFATDERGKKYVKEASVLAGLGKLWNAADDEKKGKAKKNLENYVFNPLVREWSRIDGRRYKKSDGGKILDKETELIEAAGGPAMKMWRIKGSQVVLQYELFGVKLTPKSIDESADVPDDLFKFKAPDGYKEEKSDTEGDAPMLWKELTR